MSDFSRPPPGYPGAPSSASGLSGPRGMESFALNTGNINSVNVKVELGISSPYTNSVPNQYAYYQGPNFQSSVNRAPNQSAASQLFTTPPPNVRPQDPMVSRMFRMFSAAQYVAQNQGNVRPQWAQGNYGFSKRGGYSNSNLLNRKRNMPQENAFETPTCTFKKKKKPLSHNKPSKREWTLEDAQRALDVERELNKLHSRNPSLIIKFPDLELSRDIVSKLHPLIESVHFQQPSTPRFCFVTLSDSSRVQDVLDDLNRTKFGQGYLTAEAKLSKEEDTVKGPEDIDPTALYVGNLSQEVTVDDVVKIFPKHKRIDIGFAKKMKYTRYAFVSFLTVDDAIQAFRQSHATEMYNKSLIVRFRRLHGTVGMPGDPKPKNTRRIDESESGNSESSTMNPDDVNNKSGNMAEDIPYSSLTHGSHYGASVKREAPDDSFETQVNVEDFNEVYHVPIFQAKLEPVETPEPTKIKEEPDEVSDFLGSTRDFLGGFNTDDEENI